MTRRNFSRFDATNTDPWHQVGTAGEPGFKNGWTQASGGGLNVTPVKFTRRGDVVYLMGNLNAPTAGNGSVAFTLPEGYRPHVDTYGFMVLQTNSDQSFVGSCDVAANGDVRFWKAGSTLIGSVFGLQGTSFVV